MPKNITTFVCQECGYESPQWLGKCPECGAWNSLKEFHLGARGKGKGGSNGSLPFTLNASPLDIQPQTLSQITYHETSRIKTGFAELDTVLGGGVVGGSVTLLAGDPGIGKSTLLLQLALNIAGQASTVKRQPSSKEEGENSNFSSSPLTVNGLPLKEPKVLYVSGEESVEQIKLRASRIKGALENQNLFLVSLTNTDAIAELIAKEKPSLAIIDSIQTMESEALEGLSGSVGQVRYATTAFIRVAKQLGIPVILVGHVTKEGMVAGPMVLSHMVDTVLFLEGEKFTSTRLLRSLKNRFGPVDEVGVFAMEGSGMEEIKNPEQLFITARESAVPGSALVVIMEGTRPFLIEIQALVVYSKLPMPRRVASGIDHKRLELLLAVLQKQCKLNVDTSDVFVNIAGGLKVSDPAVDLGVCLAVYASLKNVPMSDVVAIGEVGLLGEVRTVAGLEKRIKEAKKLGFKKIISGQTEKRLSIILEKVKS